MVLQEAPAPPPHLSGLESNAVYKSGSGSLISWLSLGSQVHRIDCLWEESCSVQCVFKTKTFRLSLERNVFSKVYSNMCTNLYFLSHQGSPCLPHWWTVSMRRTPMREGWFCRLVQDLTHGQVVPQGLQGQACGSGPSTDGENRVWLSAVLVPVLQGLTEGHLLYDPD